MGSPSQRDFPGSRKSSTASHRVKELEMSNTQDQSHPQSRSLFTDTNDQDVIKSEESSTSSFKSSNWFAFDDTWLLECLAMTFSFASFIAIIIILRIYDQKPSPNLSYGLTLNTIISLLATASRSSLLFVVAAAIGQLKWIWFEKRERPVSDMQSFDDASRGPMGSLFLLFQHRGLSLASLGAIVTIFAIALDPFVQQILSYPVRQTASINSQATMPQAHSFAQNNDYNSFSEYFQAGIWSSDFSITPTCSSGNCTWPEFQSVGLCSKCQDVTASTILYDCNNWTQPIFKATNHQTSSSTASEYSCAISVAGHGVNGSVTVEFRDEVRGAFVPDAAIWTLNIVDKGSSSFLGIDHPLAAIAYAELEAEASENITTVIRGLRPRRTQECVLSLCLKTYNVSVSYGVPSVNVSSVDYGNRFSRNLTNNDGAWNNELDCWRPTRSNGSESESGSFNFSKLETGDWVDEGQFTFCLHTGNAGSGIVPTVFSALADAIGVGAPFLGSSHIDYVVNSSSIWAPVTGSDKNTADYSQAFSRVRSIGLDKMLSNMAAALTKYALESSNTSAKGTVMDSRAFVQVSWAWLAFPSVLLVAAFGFWLATVLVHRRYRGRLGLWKSSILPMIYRGHVQVVQGDCHDGLDNGTTTSSSPTTGYSSIGRLDRAARSTTVRLEDITDGRISLRRR